MRVEKLELFDRNDQRCGAVEMPMRKEGDPPRCVIWQGRKFVEGGEGSYYSFGQMGEVHSGE